MKFRQNRLAGLKFIRNMHENYPEATVVLRLKMPFDLFSIMSEIPLRSYESEGMLEADEAGRMITNVEERMKDVMERSLDLRFLNPKKF